MDLAAAWLAVDDTGLISDLRSTFAEGRPRERNGKHQAGHPTWPTESFFAITSNSTAQRPFGGCQTSTIRRNLVREGAGKANTTWPKFPSHVCLPPLNDQPASSPLITTPLGCRCLSTHSRVADPCSHNKIPVSPTFCSPSPASPRPIPLLWTQSSGPCVQYVYLETCHDVDRPP